MIQLRKAASVTHKVPSVDDLGYRPRFLFLHVLLNDSSREKTTCAIRSASFYDTTMHANIPMKPTPIAIGATFDTTRFIGDSEPAFLVSARNLYQSSSSTSCKKKGCGWTDEGGRTGGKPLLKSLSRLITAHGGKGA